MIRNEAISTKIDKLSKIKSSLTRERKEYEKYHDYLDTTNDALLESNTKLLNSLKEKYSACIVLIKRHNLIDISLNDQIKIVKNRIKIKNVIDQVSNSKKDDSKQIMTPKEAMDSTVRIVKHEVKELYSRLQLFRQQNLYEEKYLAEIEELKRKKEKLEDQKRLSEQEIEFYKKQFKEISEYNGCHDLAYSLIRLKEKTRLCQSLRQDKFDIIFFHQQMQRTQNFHKKIKGLNPDSVLVAFDISLNSNASTDNISSLCQSTESSASNNKEDRNKNDQNQIGSLTSTEVKLHSNSKSSYASSNQISPLTSINKKKSTVTKSSKDSHNSTSGSQKLKSPNINEKRQKVIKEIATNGSLEQKNKTKMKSDSFAKESSNYYNNDADYYESFYSTTSYSHKKQQESSSNSYIQYEKSDRSRQNESSSKNKKAKNEKNSKNKAHKKDDSKSETDQSRSEVHYSKSETNSYESEVYSKKSQNESNQSEKRKSESSKNKSEASKSESNQNKSEVHQSEKSKSESSRNKNESDKSESNQNKSEVHQSEKSKSESNKNKNESDKSEAKDNNDNDKESRNKNDLPSQTHKNFTQNMNSDIPKSKKNEEMQSNDSSRYRFPSDKSYGSLSSYYLRPDGTRRHGHRQTPDHIPVISPEKADLFTRLLHKHHKAKSEAKKGGNIELSQAKSNSKSSFDLSSSQAFLNEFNDNNEFNSFLKKNTELEITEFDTFTQTDESFRTIIAAILNDKLQRFINEDKINDSIYKKRCQLDELEASVSGIHREISMRKRKKENWMKNFKIVPPEKLNMVDLNVIKETQKVDSIAQTDKIKSINKIRDEIIKNSKLNPKSFLKKMEHRDLVAMLTKKKLELKIIKMTNVRKQLDINSLLKRLQIVDPLMYSAETHEPAQIEVDRNILDKKQQKLDKIASIDRHYKVAITEAKMLSDQIADQQYIVEAITNYLTDMAKEPKSNVQRLCHSLKQDRSSINEVNRQIRFVTIENDSISKEINRYDDMISPKNLMGMNQKVDNLYKYLTTLKNRFNNLRAVKEKRSYVMTFEEEMNSLQRQVSIVLSEIDVYRMRINGTISKIENQTRSIISQNIRNPKPISELTWNGKSKSSPKS